MEYAKAPVDREDVVSLKKENRRLRAELERLKRQQHGGNSDAIKE